MGHIFLAAIAVTAISFPDLYISHCEQFDVPVQFIWGPCFRLWVYDIKMNSSGITSIQSVP